jgi:hypothetical protein
LVYGSVVNCWEREIERVKRGEIKAIKDEGTIARILAEFIKSKRASSEMKAEIFEKMNWLQESRDRAVLLKVFASNSAQNPQLQETILKNSVHSLASDNDRNHVLAALASQSKKNPELQLELLEDLREMPVQEAMSPILSELIKSGVDNEVLQSRILKFIDTNFDHLNEPLLLSSLAKVSKQNTPLQNWVIRRLEKLKEVDQAKILTTLSSVPNLEVEMREKIRDMLQINRDQTAKVGLALLDLEL